MKFKIAIEAFHQQGEVEAGPPPGTVLVTLSANDFSIFVAAPHIGDMVSEPFRQADGTTAVGVFKVVGRNFVYTPDSVALTIYARCEGITTNPNSGAMLAEAEQQG